MRISFIVFLLFPFLLTAQIEISNVQGNAGEKFAVVSKSSSALIYYNSTENALIHRAVGFLASDIEMVTGQKPEVTTAFEGAVPGLIIVGSLGNNDLIDELVNSKKLDVASIRGQWERFIIQTIKDPIPGVEEALVIVGSDRRGTAYGVFTISEAIGVSPWYWWADAPVKKSAKLFIQNTRFVSKAPSVKYRGIFINDEAPALRSWALERFGGFNHQFYEKVFELILRNKGNYLWPAMWVPSAFAADDPENARLADEYGIVISTSHHEPMMRAHAEWYRFKGGEWNYNTNKEKLQEFWKGGVERMGDYESVVTLGMRGDGDEAMTEETAVDLLQTIIADQREILTEVTGKPVEETPQVWAIYKEVQDYYDKGMRVDDDILVLFCDDNWGNIRILPKKQDLDRKGGFGMYYHFDFVGGPVSYRWLNVTQIERVWEQMNLAYQWGVEDLWIVNVGDIKPMELPISFFLDFAWDADIDADDLPDYYVRWASQQFGAKYAEEIAEILSLYTKYNARRTPEMLTPETYSLHNYREAEVILEEYQQLLQKSQSIYAQLPETHKSAFYQLVLSPVELCSNLNEMYVAAGKNKMYLDLGGAAANYYADKAKELFLKDAELTRRFHEDLEGGKWNHMMAQTHIGYTSWNNPPVNKMPAVSWVQPAIDAQLGLVVEYGTKLDWSNFEMEGRKIYDRAFLPFDPVNDQNYYVEIFNKGAQPLNYTITSKSEWIKLSKETGTIQLEEKVYVSIDWNKAPKGRTIGEVVISGKSGRPFVVGVPVWNELQEVSGFVENNGVLSIEAVNFTNKIETSTIGWTVIPNMGRTNSAITVEPANAEPQTPAENTPCLEYEFTVFEGGDLKIDTYLSPTLNYKKEEGLKYAIAIDGETPQIINMHEGEFQPDWEYPAWWNNSVTDHIKKKQSIHTDIEPGKHVLKVWMVDPGVVFQKFVIDAGGLRDSYLGPPESKFVPSKF
ncbi:MAG: glycosyl hydrolase [Bacteroidetes bacterium]|nr:MAG: glycosyl hydrolase [Bacteroidota bacterium]